MPAVPINNSPNITSLDSKIRTSLCDGNFYIDLSPSVWLPGGTSSSGGVQGASIQIVNPVGVTIDSYPTSGFDILPPMTSVYSFAIPLIAGVYQYGTYTISVRLTDTDGDTYTVTKSVNICPPDSNNKNRNYGCIDATLQGNCITGEMVVLLNAPPNYKGTKFTSQVNDLDLEYPTVSGLPIVEGITTSAFSVQLYEGQYKLTGTVCAYYSYGDEVYYNINYKVKCEKIVYCIIDECCVQAKLAELRLKINSDCTQAEKDETFSIFVEGNALLNFAKLTAQCGEDPSDTIADLEKLLGCKCTCNCNEGTPIIPTYATSGYFYRGLLTQASTAIPTDQVGINNTVELTFTRSGVGEYTATLVGVYPALTANNTFILTGSAIVAGATVDAFYASASTISIKTLNAAGAAADGVLGNTALQISILG